MSEDWDKPTVIRKSRPSGRDSRTPAAINRAMAMGNVEVHKKSMRQFAVSVTVQWLAGGTSRTLLRRI